jgi:hypothetical protein
MMAKMKKLEGPSEIVLDGSSFDESILISVNKLQYL